MPNTSVFQQDDLVHRKYLCKMKKSVDMWFLVTCDHGDDCANTFDCILQMNSAIKLILLDGFYSKDAKDFATNLSEFIENLDWLYSAIRKYSPHAEAIPRSKRVLGKSTLCDDIFVWINANLENAQLCDKLKLLISNPELLDKYFRQHAYLRKKLYSLPFLICLSAIEENESSLLSQIDTSLYTKNSSAAVHNLTNSHPLFSISTREASRHREDKFSNDAAEKLNAQENDVHVINILPTNKTLPLRCCQSLPNLTRKHGSKKSNASIIPNSEQTKIGTWTDEIGSSIITAPENNRFATALYDLSPIQLVKCDDIEIHVDQRLQFSQILQSTEIMESDNSPSIPTATHINLFSSSSEEGAQLNLNKSYYLKFSSTDLASVFLPREGEKLQHRCCRNSLFDSFNAKSTPGGGTSFETSSTQNATDLERENAHFHISEEIIAEIERIKWLNAEAKTKNTRRNFLTNQRTKNGKCRINTNISDEAISNECCGKFDMSDTSEFERSDCCSANKSQDLLNLDDKGIQSSDFNINEHKAFAEWGECGMETLSAEGVALSLLSKFSDVELPSNLKWLIPKQDESREFQEIRKSTHIRKDYINHPLTRGTNDWAPPRPQIIFTLHAPLDRKSFMEKQNFRCAGCGIIICSNDIHRYRYCYYFGKYHCSGCHRNQISTIPAKVLYQWDFTRYPVCIFAYRLLEEIWRYPLYNVRDLNRDMYTKVKKLELVRQQRIQLKFMKGFITSCRFAKEKQILENTRSYLLDDPNVWSMSDFETAKDATLHAHFDDLIKKCEGHINNCMLCTARGFVCELCPKKQILFPWQKNVARCEQCGTCYHEACWNSSHECYKCLRLSKRLKDNS